MAKLKQARGRQIAKLKNDARMAMPSGSPEQLVAKASDLATEQGLAYEFKIEHFDAPAAPKRKVGRPPKTTSAASTVNVTMVAVEAAQQVGGLTRLKKIVEELL